MIDLLYSKEAPLNQELLFMNCSRTAILIIQVFFPLVFWFKKFPFPKTYLIFMSRNWGKYIFHNFTFSHHPTTEQGELLRNLRIGIFYFISNFYNVVLHSGFLCEKFDT